MRTEPNLDRGDAFVLHLYYMNASSKKYKFTQSRYLVLATHICSALPVMVQTEKSVFFQPLKMTPINFFINIFHYIFFRTITVHCQVSSKVQSRLYCYFKYKQKNKNNNTDEHENDDALLIFTKIAHYLASWHMASQHPVSSKFRRDKVILMSPAVLLPPTSRRVLKAKVHLAITDRLLL